MKGIWKFSLSLSMGLLTGALWADEVQWRSAAARPSVPPATQAPLALPPKEVARTPAVSLDKPVKPASPPRPVVDTQLQPVSLSTPIAAKTVVRGQGGEPPKALPVGPPVVEQFPPAPTKVTEGKPVEVPAGTIVLPYGTYVPPGSPLPPNVIIAPGPTPGPVVPVPAPHETMMMPGQGPVMMMPGQGPVMMMPGQGPILSGPLPPDAVPGQVYGPVETIGPQYGQPGMPMGDACPYPEITCGTPGVCCETAESCADSCCEEGFCADDCFGGNKRFWVRGEYLMWWFKDAPTAPLLTTGNTGILGANGTATVIGNKGYNDQFNGGGRLEMGYWFTENQSIGIDGSVLFFPGSTNTDFRASDGLPQLFRPFTNIAGGGRGVPAAEELAIRDSIAGTFKIETDTWLYSGDINAVCRLACGPWYRVTALGGFRYLGVGDSLEITERGTALTDMSDIGFPAGSSFTVSDSFETSNNFFGGQLGIGAEFKLGKKCFLDLRTKAAIGCMVQSVEVNGTTVTPQGQQLTGGLLAQPSNIGKDHKSRFAVVPEGTVTLGCNITDWWRVHVGYTFLYASSVVRAADQIDTRVNGARLPGSGVPYLTSQPPRIPFKATDFWAQGVNFGMEFRW